MDKTKKLTPHEGTTTHVVSSNMTRGKIGVKDEHVSLMVALLANLYSNPEQAIVRELVSNALDANTALARQGVPESELSIKVTTRSYENFEHWGDGESAQELFTIEDTGVGMSRDDLLNTYTFMGASTKADDMSLIGARGLGAKSPLSIFPSFTVRTVKDGKENTIIVGVDGDEFTYSLFDEVDVPGKRSGTVVTISGDPTRISRMRSFAHDFLRHLPSTSNFKVDGKLAKAEENIYSPQNLVYSCEDYDVYVHSPANVDAFTMFRTGYIVIGGYPYTVGGGWGNGIVVVRPGVVDFTPSRDDIIENERLSKLLDDVNKNALPVLCDSLAQEIGECLSVIGEDFYEMYKLLKEMCSGATSVGVFIEGHVSFKDCGVSLYRGDVQTSISCTAKQAEMLGVMSGITCREAVARFIEKSGAFKVSQHQFNPYHQLRFIKNLSEGEALIVAGGDDHHKSIASPVRRCLRMAKLRSLNAKNAGHDMLRSSSLIIPIPNEEFAQKVSHALDLDILYLDDILAEEESLTDKTVKEVTDERPPIARKVSYSPYYGTAVVNSDHERIVELGVGNADDYYFIIGSKDHLSHAHWLVISETLRGSKDFLFLEIGNELTGHNMRKLLPIIKGRVAMVCPAPSSRVKYILKALGITEDDMYRVLIDELTNSGDRLIEAGGGPEFWDDIESCLFTSYISPFAVAGMGRGIDPSMFRDDPFAFALAKSLALKDRRESGRVLSGVDARQYHGQAWFAMSESILKSIRALSDSDVCGSHPDARESFNRIVEPMVRELAQVLRQSPRVRSALGEV